MTALLALALLAQIQFEGLDLGNDAKSEPAREVPPKVHKGPAAPAAPLKFEALDVEAKTAERDKLDAAIWAMDQDGDYQAAAVAFHALLAEPKAAEYQGEILYRLGKCLYKLRLYHSALKRFDQVLANGDQEKRFKTSLEWLLFVGRKVKDKEGVLSLVARYANAEFPEKYKGEFNFLLAKYHFARAEALMRAESPDEAKKSFAEARRLTVLVPPENKNFPKAKYLEGLVFYQQGIDDLALESFKEVVRITNPRTGQFKGKKLRELAFLQLARIHYGHRQNRNSIFYYAKLKRGSPRWLRALFESGWAHYRIGGYEKALGNLVTLNAPFFKEEYYPEAMILQAVIYYENCRYAEARAIIADFEKTYQPVHDELSRMTGPETNPGAFYDLFAEVRKAIAQGDAPKDTLLARILKLALTDPELDRLNDAILELETENDSLAERKDFFKNSALALDLIEKLKAERQERIGQAGVVAKVKLSQELTALKSLLGQALRIQFETSSREKEALEGLLAEDAKPGELLNYYHSVAVEDDEQFWPYEGEFWRDELGTYQYTLSRGCKKR